MSLPYVVVDTDVASAVIRRRLDSRAQARLMFYAQTTSFVTAGELIKWARLRDLDTRRVAALEAWLAQVVVLDVDEHVTTTWGEVQARAHRRGRPSPANDSWVAASCLAYELPLATYNRKDYQDTGTRHAPLRPATAEARVLGRRHRRHRVTIRVAPPGTTLRPHARSPPGSAAPSTLRRWKSLGASPMSCRPPSPQADCDRSGLARAIACC